MDIQNHDLDEANHIQRLKQARHVELELSKQMCHDQFQDDNRFETSGAEQKSL